MPLSDETLTLLKEKARRARHDMIDITAWAGGAHIGGALSMVEMGILLYYRVARIDPDRPDMPDRDRIVVSKGHAGVGIAAILARKGYFPFQGLRDFNKFKSPFGMHLDSCKVPGVDVSTGSLGHGLPMAVGLALGARVQQRSWRTYCILGDGECNEGSVWEAAMAAGHYGLTNLVTFVDRNRLMIDGPTEEVMALEPLADKWRAFGFIVKEVDGHNFRELDDAVAFAHAQKESPVLIMAHTVKGKGIDFMENDVRWHYGGMDTDLVEKAKASVDRMCGEDA
jgi:transketolase